MIESKDVQTLAALFRERVKLTPQWIAYRYYNKQSKTWQELTWQHMSQQVARWQAAFAQENLEVGDRVAIMVRNSPQWVMFDQAALGLGLVTVPLYIDDRPDNVAYIVEQANVKVLFLDGEIHWKRLYDVRQELVSVNRIVLFQAIDTDTLPDERLMNLEEWLPTGETFPLQAQENPAEELASIVYTSGTTGKPKGVMLSHRNMLLNAQYCAQTLFENNILFDQHDVFLSFLPLSHMFERTAGYYLPMVSGATVAYARSIPQLSADFLELKPTTLISVPRIYEQVYSKILHQLQHKPAYAQKLFKLALDVGWRRFEYQQKRATWHPKLLLWPMLSKMVARPILDKLGGKVKLAISGGAALPPAASKLFLSLGLNLIQGYGLTETSPVISVSRPRKNIPESIGFPISNIVAKVGDNEELLTRGDCIMMGYWKNEEATKTVIDEKGWFHTGDKARCDEQGFYYITGRIKEIIVMGNGEKVPPGNMESSIAADSLFDQVMVLGEGKAYLSALVVLNPEGWQTLAKELQLDPDDATSLQNKMVHKKVLARIGELTKDFPGYSKIRRVGLSLEPWTIQNGLLTPTLKIKRAKIMEYYKEEVEKLYEGFESV